MAYAIRLADDLTSKLFTAVATLPALTTLVTCGEESIKILAIGMMNTAGSPITVDLRMTDASESVTAYVLSGTSIASKTRLVVGGDEMPVELDEEDTLQVGASAGGSLDIIMTYHVVRRL